MAVLIIVCDMLQCVLRKSISVKALVFVCDLVNGFVERKTAEVGLNDLTDSGLVLFGHMVFVSSNKGIYINACGAFGVMFVTHADSFL